MVSFTDFFSSSPKAPPSRLAEPKISSALVADVESAFASPQLVGEVESALTANANTEKAALEDALKKYKGYSSKKGVNTAQLDLAAAPGQMDVALPPVQASAPNIVGQGMDAGPDVWGDPAFSEVASGLTGTIDNLPIDTYEKRLLKSASLLHPEAVLDLIMSSEELIGIELTAEVLNELLENGGHLKHKVHKEPEPENYIEHQKALENKATTEKSEIDVSKPEDAPRNSFNPATLAMIGNIRNTMINKYGVHAEAIREGELHETPVTQEAKQLQQARNHQFETELAAHLRPEMKPKSDKK